MNYCFTKLICRWRSAGLLLPVIVSAGDVVSSTNLSTSFNGYLADTFILSPAVQISIRQLFRNGIC